MFTVNLQTNITAQTQSTGGTRQHWHYVINTHSSY